MLMAEEGVLVGAGLDYESGGQPMMCERPQLASGGRQPCALGRERVECRVEELDLSAGDVIGVIGRLRSV